MARNTRQKRAQKRRERTKAADGEKPKVASRARARQQQVRPAAQAVKPQTGSRRVPGGGTKRFIGEATAELKKVEWPNRAQVLQGTVVVIIACAIVGAYLWGVDQVLRRLVQDVFI